MPVTPALVGTIPFALPTTGYCTLSDIRDEGVTTDMASDALVNKRILTARRYIDKITRRWFDGRTLSLFVDGRGSKWITLDIPIISISALYVSPEAAPGDGDWGQPVDASGYTVYNRHMQGVFNPDDRESPKVVLVDYADVPVVGYPSIMGSTFLGVLRQFPTGRANIRLDGIFGYTDPDGTSTGATPEDIKKVNMLLALRELPLYSDFDSREDRQKRQRITQEWTREQGVQMEKQQFRTDLTGDPAIDTILLDYSAPPYVGATSG